MYKIQFKCNTYDNWTDWAGKDYMHCKELHPYPAAGWLSPKWYSTENRAKRGLEAFENRNYAYVIAAMIQEDLLK